MTLLAITLILTALTYWTFRHPKTEAGNYLHALGRICVGGSEPVTPRTVAPLAGITVAPVTPAWRGTTGAVRGGDAATVPVTTSKETL